MTRHALRIPDYLEHILEAIRRIVTYTEDLTEVVFLEDEKTQDAVIRNFEVIGEASRNIERNQVAHGYFKVDLEIVWRTIQHDLPLMEADIQRLLKNISRS